MQKHGYFILSNWEEEGEYANIDEAVEALKTLAESFKG